MIKSPSSRINEHNLRICEGENKKLPISHGLEEKLRIAVYLVFF
jgi:hypothetical protein